MDDEAPEIDWEAVRLASMALAEVTWSYHQALIASGFTEQAALALTMNYQQVWLGTVTG